MAIQYCSWAMTSLLIPFVYLLESEISVYNFISYFMFSESAAVIVVLQEA